MRATPHPVLKGLRSEAGVSSGKSRVSPSPEDLSAVVGKQGTCGKQAHSHQGLFLEMTGRPGVLRCASQGLAVPAWPRQGTTA